MVVWNRIFLRPLSEPARADSLHIFVLALVFSALMLHIQSTAVRGSDDGELKCRNFGFLQDFVS
jgi:hypothetical protein